VIAAVERKYAPQLVARAGLGELCDASQRRQPTVFAGRDQSTNRNGTWTTSTCVQISGGCLIAPHSYGFGLGDFTIECWLSLGVPARNGSTIVSTKVPGGGYSGFIFVSFRE
jgi:hypothetical protein